MGTSAFAAGAVAYQLSRRGFISFPSGLAGIPANQHDRFMAVWFAHGASYLVGLTARYLVFGLAGPRQPLCYLALPADARGSHPRRPYCRDRCLCLMGSVPSGLSGTAKALASRADPRAAFLWLINERSSPVEYQFEVDEPPFEGTLRQYLVDPTQEEHFSPEEQTRRRQKWNGDATVAAGTQAPLNENSCSSPSP